MTTKNLPTLIVTLCCLASVPQTKASDGCPLPKGGTPARLDYLRGDRSTLEPKCILEAINHIDGRSYPQAGAVLIQYLDFRDPTLGQMWTPAIMAYPAIGALYIVGKSVVPELIEAVARPDTSEVIRDNATSAIFTIYRSSVGGITALVSAAHEEKDPTASGRLMGQARKFAARCRPAERNDCESAVLK